MKKKYFYLIIIFLIVVSCAAFGRIAGNEFFLIFDGPFFNVNYYTQSGISLESIKWAFADTHLFTWQPIAWISFMLEWNLFGASASGHHIVNLLLHIGTAIFLFLFFNKTTNNIWPSAFVASFLALHPLRVEPIAYVPCRQDVLSMFLGMACLYTYAFYAEKLKIYHYLLCLLLFALALMSKPIMVTLPFVLMLLDYWPLKRWHKTMDAQSVGVNSVGRLIWEKVPFICLTIASSIITLRVRNPIVFRKLPLIERATNAIVSYASYLGKIFWPFDLVSYYPYEFLPLWKILISGFILIFITVIVIYYIKKLPFLFVGWFWYLGTLIPVIGFIMANPVTMSERYTYFPSVGIAVMLAWGMPSLIKSENIRKKILFPAAIAFLIILSVLTWHQCSYWKNNITLISHIKDKALPPNFLGVDLGINNERLKINYYTEKICAYYYAEDYNKRANAYAKQGEYNLAMEYYDKAITIKENYMDAHYLRGANYMVIGQWEKGFEDFHQAIIQKEDYARAYKNRAAFYLSHGKKELGCRDAQNACAWGNCKLLEYAKGKGDCQ